MGSVCVYSYFSAHHLTRGRKSLDAVYGGQVIGQALVAASATVHDDFIPHSLHSYFLKSGKSGAQKLINVTSGSVLKPILYMIDRVRDGRSFCTRCVKGVQDGEAIYTAEISFHKAQSTCSVFYFGFTNL
jgi:acyl-CoA thioesterase II